MNDKRYRWILYTITTVIVVTIAIQVYWNYKNYQTNKQQLINDVQVSLDKAVDDYYTTLAERTTVGVFFEGDYQKDPLAKNGKIEHFLTSIDTIKHEFKDVDSIDINSIDGITVLKGFKIDSMDKLTQKKANPSLSITELKKKMDSLKKTDSSIDFNDIQLLTSKIVISIKNDTLDLSKVYSLVKQELNRKNINVDYDLVYYDILENDNLKPNDTLNTDSKVLTTVSKSAFLPKESTLRIEFINETKVILKRILVGILISCMLVLAVISCLFYLLKIINQQKQLAEVKNDLISNITHEFKTPIATIGAALEGINSFNIIDDKEKTKKYIDMSSGQLSKLNLMVEKLLETATLDSESLELNKEEIDIVTLLTALSSRYQTHNTAKTIETSFKVEKLLAKVDIFHFENALNNILDNAVKYGGDVISIDLIQNKNSFNINISDNGKSLTKTNKERIFEKFYRVPKGNKHDVKGFGIGLYYTKSIIEKHKGTIDLSLNKNLTTFKITLPNG